MDIYKASKNYMSMNFTDGDIEDFLLYIKRYDDWNSRFTGGRATTQGLSKDFIPFKAHLLAIKRSRIISKILK